MVDLGSLVLLIGIFGWKVATFYVTLGLIVAVLGGTLIEKMHMEKYVESFIFSAGGVDLESPELSLRDRLQYARDRVSETFHKVFPYILFGVGIGAVIHNWVPETWVQAVLGGDNPFGVILAVLLGVPMYADIFGTIPVAEAWKRSTMGGRSVLHDGGNNAVLAFYDHAAQGYQAQTPGFVCRYLYHRNHPCGILF